MKSQFFYLNLFCLPCFMPMSSRSTCNISKLTEPQFPTFPQIMHVLASWNNIMMAQTFNMWGPLSWKRFLLKDKTTQVNCPFDVC